jgi:hypothetical protein
MDTMNSLPPTSFWQGEKVRLRAIEPSDWETYFAWNQDDELIYGLTKEEFVAKHGSVKDSSQTEGESDGSTN